MSLLSALGAVATKLGLIRVATVVDPKKKFTKITTRPIRLRDLITELRASDVCALADAPSEMSVPFDQLFAAAGIPTPAHGWSVDKLAQFLASEPCKSLDRPQAQVALLAALASEKVPVEDLVKDAMARDKAIDAYGARIFEKRQSRRQARSSEKTGLQNQIAALQSRLARLDEDAAVEDQLWREWWQRKLACEKQMAAAINYLLKDPVVTIDDQLPPDRIGG
jgi:hypothetical protein